jgi:hypothetical protein
LRWSPLWGPAGPGIRAVPGDGEDHEGWVGAKEASGVTAAGGAAAGWGPPR